MIKKKKRRNPFKDPPFLKISVFEEISSGTASQVPDPSG